MTASSRSKLPSLRERPYDWRDLADMILRHRREIILANLIAILGTVVSVPVPLLIPMLVDEVLLDQPGAAVGLMNRIFPEGWQGPVLYVLAILVLTLVLRLASLALGVWQMRQFTAISKDVIYRIRRDLLLRLQRVSMAEYETLGSAKVASHLVTDLDSVDQFLGSATSKFLVAVLSILGTALVLLWMHWQLALFILFLNPLVIYVTTVFGRKVKELKRRENSAYEAFPGEPGRDPGCHPADPRQQPGAPLYQRIIGSAERIRDFSCTFTWKSDAGNRLSFLVFLFGFDIFRALSMLMVLFSDLSIGQMLAVFAYLWFMMGPVQEVLGIQYAYHSASAALGRINRLFEIGLEPSYPQSGTPSPAAHRRRRAGERLLLLRRRPPGAATACPSHRSRREGRLRGRQRRGQDHPGADPARSLSAGFGQDPVRRGTGHEIGMDLVRDNVATVLQHPALFNDTVHMNLTLGRDSRTRNCGTPWRWLSFETLSRDWTRDWTPWWAAAVFGSPVASASAWPSPAWCSRTRAW